MNIHIIKNCVFCIWDVHVCAACTYLKKYSLISSDYRYLPQSFLLYPQGKFAVSSRPPVLLVFGLPHFPPPHFPSIDWLIREG